MSKITDKKIYCIIDANLNRAKEGLRVCEDIVRFILKDELLRRRIKRLRHDVTHILTEPKIGLTDLIQFRDSSADLGREPDFLEKKRQSTADIFLANFQRAKEAVRVLEEFSKLINPKLSDRFKKLRFRLYSIEKETFKQF